MEPPASPAPHEPGRPAARSGSAPASPRTPADGSADASTAGLPGVERATAASGRDGALRAALGAVADHRPLTQAGAAEAFGVIMEGAATPAQIGALLLGLRARGETAAELAGVVRAMRHAMIVLPADRREELVDTCGTGGGGFPTFNVSTVAAFVAAGAGVRIAKHGNRSYTSACGSADVLEALGIPLDAPVAALAHVLAEAGIVFMFAPLMHPAMRHVASVRRELGVPTLMNLVGPLANPAGASRQVIGVADPQRLGLVAAALRELETRCALVVHGAPGLDEISPLGLTQVAEVGPQGERRWTIDPRDFDLHCSSAADLRCGEPRENARIAKDVLAGRGPAGARAAVVLNAAAAIFVSGRAPSYDGAVSAAIEALDHGAGLEALGRMQAAYERYGTES
jgi:anthranilate phosphoribosyltransferase